MWITRAEKTLPDPDLVLFDPGKAEIGHLRSSAAAELDSGDQRRRPARPNALSRKISNERARLDRALIRSDPPDPNVPVRPGSFSKETISFSLFNPQSTSSQKYSQFSPEISAQPPKLFRI